MQRSEAQQALIRLWGKVHPSESQIAAVWEHRLFQNEALYTVDGRTLQVVFPGRKSGLRGPDFSDAMLVIDGCLQKGSVEIHVRSSDFHRHRHDMDRRYDNLILHVVLMQDADELKLNGKVPILDLGRLLEGLPDIDSSVDFGESLPCTQAIDLIGLKRLTHHLERAGEDRFKIKAGRFLGDICYFGQEEALYQGVMEAMGYSQNKEPFLALARSVTSAMLRTTSELALKEANEHIQSLLLWASSLEPGGQKPEEAQQYGVIRLKRDEWELSRIRPDNHPINRISGISLLMAAACKQSSGLEEYLLKPIGSQGGFSELVNLLSIQDHGRTLIGTQRATEIAINVVLPYAFGRAELQNDAGSSALILNVFRSAAKTPENHITNQMYRQFGLSRTSLRTACQQQGLLYFYKERCQDLRCADCSIAAEVRR